MLDDKQAPERGAFAKRIKELGLALGALRKAVVVMANDLSRTGELSPDAQRRLQAILNADEGGG